MRKLLILMIVGVLLSSYVFAIDIASDGFESGTMTGGMGWADNWVITGQVYPWYSSHTGTYGTFINGQASITREVDLSSYNNNKLGFWINVVSSPQTVSYVIDGQETILETFTSVGGYVYREYDLPSDVISIKFNNDEVSSVSYVDDILITGDVGVTSEVSLLIENNYVVGKTNTVISADSTEADTLHTIRLSDNSGTVFCEHNAISPSVPNTAFTIFCDMPSYPIVDAKAFLFVTNDISINDTKYFNVLEPLINPDEIDIQQVYFSPQVLQGGNTEIFAVIESVNPLDYIVIELTYPDSRKRLFNMGETSNTNEYRAFITDTYQTGNILFEISVKSGEYFDTYNNSYEVAAYNVDFVNIVKQVGEVLSVHTVQDINETKIEVHGTEYTAADRGKIFIQVLDGSSQPVTTAACYASIYYPDDTPFKYQQIMTYVDEGLYNYNFDVPYPAGVYMVSSFCYLGGLNTSGKIVDETFESGTTSGGNGWSTTWSLGGAELSTSSSHTGSYSMLIANDDNPDRDFTSTLTYESIDVSFWWRATSIEGGEYVYFYLDDASGTSFLLETITDGDDDGVWHHSTNSFTVVTNSFDFDGTLTFRATTSNNLENGDYLYFDDINLSLNAPSANGTENYQVVRGSGEVHVSSDNGVFVTSLNIGELKNTTFIDEFVFHFDVISQTAVDLEDRDVYFTLWEPFPCDHVLNVTLHHDNGTIEVLEYTTGLDELERCIINAKMDLATQATYDVEITSENFWKKMFLEDYGTMLLEEEMINISCSNYVQANSLPSFQVPLIDYSTNPGSQDALWQSCQSYLDASYHIKEVSANFFPFININFNFTYEQMTSLESNFIHMKNIKSRLEGYANTLFNGLNLGGTYSLGLIVDPYPPTNPLYAQYFASISTSYLNYNDRQLLPGKIWNYSPGRNLTYYAPASVDIDAVGNAVWNYTPHRNLTYYETASVNYTAVGEAVWGENHTINVGLLGQMVYGVWDYVARYTHGEII